MRYGIGPWGVFGGLTEGALEGFDMAQRKRREDLRERKTDLHAAMQLLGVAAKLGEDNPQLGEQLWSYAQTMFQQAQQPQQPGLLGRLLGRRQQQAPPMPFAGGAMPHFASQEEQRQRAYTAIDSVLNDPNLTEEQKQARLSYMGIKLPTERPDKLTPHYTESGKYAGSFPLGQGPPGTVPGRLPTAGQGKGEGEGVPIVEIIGGVPQVRGHVPKGAKVFREPKGDLEKQTHLPETMQQKIDTIQDDLNKLAAKPTSSRWLGGSAGKMIYGDDEAKLKDILGKLKSYSNRGYGTFQAVPTESGYEIKWTPPPQPQRRQQGKGLRSSTSGELPAWAQGKSFVMGQ